MVEERENPELVSSLGRTQLDSYQTILNPQEVSLQAKPASRQVEKGPPFGR